MSCDLLLVYVWNVSVSVWGICPYRTAFFLLILGYFIDTYVDLGSGLGLVSIVEEEDEDEGESEGESEGKDKDVDGNREDWN